MDGNLLRIPPRTELSDFLVELDLTPRHQAFARRLKAEANLKQLLNSLGDHALFFSRQVVRARGSNGLQRDLPRSSAKVVAFGSETRDCDKRPRNGKSKGAAITVRSPLSQRQSVLQWFESLEVAQRIAVLTCQDAAWLRTVLQMARVRGSSQSLEGRFRLVPPRPNSNPSGAASKNLQPPEPRVQYRRPHCLPDGSWLVSPATDAQRNAWRSLLEGFRLIFRGCCTQSQAFEWSSAMISASLVTNCKDFVALMDEVSMGHFLENCPTHTTVAAWAEAPWLQQWGTHFPMAAFVGSRLEVLLIQGFAAREAVATRPPSLPLANVWLNMSVAARANCLCRLGRGLLRRLLSETFAITSGLELHGEWKPPLGLAELLAETTVLSHESADAKTIHAEFSQRPPLDLVAGATSVSLASALLSTDETARGVLLGAPRLWLHQQFGEELAILCSEHSANTLLEDEKEEAEVASIAIASAARESTKRREKKQRQKLRRKQAAQDLQRESAIEDVAGQSSLEHQDVHVQRGREAAETVEELLEEMLDTVIQIVRNRNIRGVPMGDSHVAVMPYPHELHQDHSEGNARMQQGSFAVQVNVRDLPTVGNSGALLEDTGDGTRSERSSSCFGESFAGPTTRSNSFDGLTLSDLQRHPWGYPQGLHGSLLGRHAVDEHALHPRQRTRRSSRRWHEDSRLEFLLRNRDRFGTERDWDLMSQGSVPASLDERALYPMGLETRFAYLFDPPTPRSHSHVTTSALASRLASQTTIEDDDERLRLQWEDFEDWRSLTEALEKTETELQRWKAKAQELEESSKRQSPQHGIHKDSGSHDSCGSDAGTISPSQNHIKSSVTSLQRQSSRSSNEGASSVAAWRYLALLVLARDQLKFQQLFGSSRLSLATSYASPMERQISSSSLANAASPDGGCPDLDLPTPRAWETVRTCERSYSMPGLGGTPGAVLQNASVGVAANRAHVGTGSQRDTLRSPSPEDRGDELLASPLTPERRGEVGAAQKRALHVSFEARRKRTVDGSTQTAPAITFSKMYGGMVPRYIQRELAHLRQENQILRYRVASLAMSQPIGRPRPVRHQATQTAPAITFSTARQQGSTSSVPGIGGIPRTPVRLEVSAGSARRRQVVPESTEWSTTDPRNVIEDTLAAYPPTSLGEAARPLSDHMRNSLEESVRAFVRAVELQTARQKPYLSAVHDRCRRVVRTLWPRSSLDLYGSFASGLALPSSGLDLVIYPNRNELSLMSTEEDARSTRSVHVLSPIDEDVDQLRPLPLDEVSPGHPSTVPSLSSGWQQQLSCRLAQEGWVLTDSIRVTAHAAVPFLSIIATPEEESPANTTVEGASTVNIAVDAKAEEEPLSFPVRVDISLDDPNHRGLRSRAFLSWLLNEFPYARPVTLVLKQWLIERTYGMSYTGGLCSYGLLLMVVGYLQHYPANSVAAGLVGCLDFYGRRFDPQLYGVSIARQAFPHRKNPMSWPPARAEYIEHAGCPGVGEFASLPRKLSLTGEEAHRFDPLWIEDPLNPTNNVGRNCFRIRQIQMSLARAADALTSMTEVGPGSQLRAILRVEGHGAEAAGPGATGDSCNGASSDGATSFGLRRQRWDEARRHQAVQVRHALHEDLYASLVEPNVMPPQPVRAQIARSHLPQQWDSAVRYAARPHCARGRC